MGGGGGEGVNEEKREDEDSDEDADGEQQQQQQQPRYRRKHRKHRNHRKNTDARSASDATISAPQSLRRHLSPPPSNTLTEDHVVTTSDVMLSRYNEGTRYPPHVDAPIDGSSDFRVTVIYFLAPPTQGGELRIFTPQYNGARTRHTAGTGTDHGIAGVDAMDIEPRADRMVLLLSRGVVHQVLPTRGARRRLLLTAWWRTHQRASSDGGDGGGKLEKSNGNVCVRRSGVAIGGARTRMAEAEAQAETPVSAHAKAEAGSSARAGEMATDGGPRLH